MDIKQFDIIFLSDEILKLKDGHATNRPCIIINNPQKDRYVIVIHTTRQLKENFEQIVLKSCPGSYITIKQDISEEIDLQSARNGKQYDNDWVLTPNEIDQIYRHFQI